MSVLTTPLEHDCAHLIAEHYISAADDRWHCHVDGRRCSRAEPSALSRRGGRSTIVNPILQIEPRYSREMFYVVSYQDGAGGQRLRGDHRV